LTILAVIIRFKGDAGDLLDRFERARQKWTAAQGNQHERPLFYVACRTGGGIAIVSVWESVAGHRAFGQGLHGYVDEGELPAPSRIERMRVERIGWD
jgi:hypothetical protein